MTSIVQIAQTGAEESSKKLVCQSKSSTGLAFSPRVITQGRLPKAIEFYVGIHGGYPGRTLSLRGVAGCFLLL